MQESGRTIAEICELEQSGDNRETVFACLDTTTKKIGGEVKTVPANTALNFLKILRLDNRFCGVRFNLLRGVPEKHNGGKVSLWTDADDASSRTYIEATYGLSNRQKFEDAFAEFQHEREYDPIQTRIDSIKWDGVSRVQSFFTDCLKCEDTPYNRECSRLLFAGGITRAFKPGSKFDDVIVLVGKQGGGKTTICQWLAMAPELYSSAKTISGQRGLEAIQGKWIVELEELLATLANEHSGEKAEETAKAFLSTASDFYRKPYDHRPQDNPRHCIFIGTTNRDTFLTDKTGNRRWYPVRVNVDGRWIFEHEQEIKEYIRQCWAEMREAFQNGDPLSLPVACADMVGAIKEQQQEAEQEDWKVGVIERYCESRKSVCLLELWQCALYVSRAPYYPEMRRRDSNELAEILVHKLGWFRGGPEYFDDFGKQRSFRNPHFKERGYELL